ncbi:hypothetical protein HAX54_017477 [Datura stramonium]|uniref:Uncharacterized protein n=1 Tax=Datura stramonium TaxID=4076 RepID=A0ABS8S3Y2_DATST|nr:hypothetical protein [Datura stramonium]
MYALIGVQKSRNIGPFNNKILFLRNKNRTPFTYLISLPAFLANFFVTYRSFKWLLKEEELKFKAWALVLLGLGMDRHMYRRVLAPVSQVMEDPTDGRQLTAVMATRC